MPTAGDGPYHDTVTALATPDRATRWLTVGLHGLFLLLVAVSVTRAGSVAATAAGIVIAAWYLLGVALRQRRDPHTAQAWVAVLVLLWAAATWFAAIDFVWLSFPLFFVVLFLLPTHLGLIVVAAVTAFAVGALGADGGLATGEVVGPILGALVAVLSAVSYRRLAAEHRETQRLLAELEATRDLLAEAERERGALDERRRLAREVHDTIAQGLSSIVLLARAAELAGDDPTVRLRQIEEIAAQNLTEARRIVAALNPADLDEAPLPAVLERAARTVAVTTGIPVEVRVEGEPVRLPVAQDVTLLRIAQGALANAGAHAHARRIDVTLDYDDTATTLTVADDGAGFDPTRPSDGAGVGLQVMRDRLDEVGGTLQVISAPGAGTSIVASIPRSRP